MTYCEPLRVTAWHQPEPDPEMLWVHELKKRGEAEWLILLGQHVTAITDDQIAKLYPELAPVNTETATIEQSLERRFLEQAEKWQKETEHLSSPTQMMMHPSYQAVLGMVAGHEDEITRLMLRDLRDHRRPWFWALSYITKDNPIKPSEAGRLEKMITAWVAWGKQKGIL